MLGAALPAWEPHPDVWLLVVAIVAGYAIAVTRLGPRLAPDPQRPVNRFQLAAFVAAVLALLVASDWPVHEVAERSMYSVHMLQHLVYTTLVAPLLLMATPGWLARWILSPRWLLASVRWWSRFLPGVVLFSLVVVVSHWPAFVRVTIENAPAHFGAHTLLVVSSLIVWMPVLSPLAEVPRMAIPLRGAYLFLQSVMPTIPATFLTYGQRPLYRIYEGFPKLWGFTALEDQQLAGVWMKTGAGLILWLIITVLFFRWAAEEERKDRRPRTPSRTLELQS
jgi:putative membrane protein